MKEDKELPPHGRETEVSKLSVDFIQAQMTRIYSLEIIGLKNVLIRVTHA